MSAGSGVGVAGSARLHGFIGRPHRALMAVALIVLTLGGAVVGNAGAHGTVLRWTPHAIALDASATAAGRIPVRPTSPLPESGAFSVAIYGVPPDGQVAAGAPFNLTAVSYGGNPTNRFFSAYDGLGEWSANSTWTFVPDAVGFHHVNVTVLDVTDASGNASASVFVYEANPLAAVGITVALDGDRVVFTAHPYGGSPPYEYRWSGPGAPGGWVSNDSWSTGNVPTGRIEYACVVQDRFNATASSNVEVVTTAPRPWYDPILLPLGVVIALAAALPVVYWIRRRHRRD